MSTCYKDVTESGKQQPGNRTIAETNLFHQEGIEECKKISNSDLIKMARIFIKNHTFNKNL
jgi:hypothetical protein